MSRRIRTEETVDGITIATFRDKKLLDERQIHEMGEEFYSLVGNGVVKLVIDFSGLEYMSSAALGKFITLNKSTAAAGGKLVLCSINTPSIWDTFKITKLNKIIECRKDVDQALECFKQPA